MLLLDLATLRVWEIACHARTTEESRRMSLDRQLKSKEDVLGQKLGRE